MLVGNTGPVRFQFQSGHEANEQAPNAPRGGKLVRLSATVVDAKTGEVRSPGSRWNHRSHEETVPQRSPCRPKDSLAVALQIPGKTQSRRKIAPARVIGLRNRQARAKLLDRGSIPGYVRVKRADVVADFDWRCVVLVAQTCVQSNSGRYPPIILHESRVPMRTVGRPADYQDKSTRCWAGLAGNFVLSKRRPCLPRLDIRRGRKPYPGIQSQP